MPASSGDWRSGFLFQPPELEGGVRLEVTPAVVSEEGTLNLRFSQDEVVAELRAAFLSVPYPSGLRRLLAGRRDIEAVLVEHIPSGLDAAARDAGISYLDPRGNGRVVAPGLVYVVPPRGPLIHRVIGGDVSDGPEEEPPKARRRVSPFAPKASRIPRALLAGLGRAWRLSELADEADVDPGNAHRVLGALVDMGLLERDGERYLVPDPGSLLEAWAEGAPRPRERLVAQLPVPPLEWLGELPRLPRSAFAVSGELAAELVAPHLEARQVLVHCLEASAFEWLRERIDGQARPTLNSMGRVVAVRSDEGVGEFGRDLEGLPLVSLPQLYVDLYRERGRGREAAEHVRREALAY